MYRTMMEEMVQRVPQPNKTQLDSFLDEHLVDANEVTDFSFIIGEKWMEQHEAGLSLERAIAGAVIDGLCFGLYVQLASDNTTNQPKGSSKTNQ
jgi:hypothetical protein